MIKQDHFQREDDGFRFFPFGQPLRFSGGRGTEPLARAAADLADELRLPSADMARRISSDSFIASSPTLSRCRQRSGPLDRWLEQPIRFAAFDHGAGFITTNVHEFSAQLARFRVGVEIAAIYWRCGVAIWDCVVVVHGFLKIVGRSIARSVSQSLSNMQTPLYQRSHVASDGLPSRFGFSSGGCSIPPPIGHPKQLEIV